MIRTKLPTQSELDILFPGEKVIIQRTIPALLEISGEEVNINIPEFSVESVRSGDCSRYVRYTAKILFGKNYARCHGWNRGYLDKSVHKITQEDLAELVDKGILLPGQVIGIKYEQSRHKNTIDMQGNTARYTHNALYLGKSPNLNRTNTIDLMLFAEQFIQETRIVRARRIYEKGLIPVEILDEKI